MKNILVRLLVAAALTLAALALSSSAHGQQADEDCAHVSWHLQDSVQAFPAVTP